MPRASWGLAGLGVAFGNLPEHSRTPVAAGCSGGPRTPARRLENANRWTSNLLDAALGLVMLEGCHS